VKKASILLLAVFMLLSLIACKEEDPAVQENGALTADVSDDISDVSAESGINSDISDISSDTSDVSSESMESTDSIKNLALGKKYTLTGIYQDETGKEYWGDSEAYKLTDGMTGGKEDMAYVSPVWVGLNVNGKDTKKNNGKTTITVDLEKVEEEFQKATLYALEGKSAGIGAPKSVEVCFSKIKWFLPQQSNLSKRRFSVTKIRTIKIVMQFMNTALSGLKECAQGMSGLRLHIVKLGIRFGGSGHSGFKQTYKIRALWKH
jgi:hypothetical protein